MSLTNFQGHLESVVLGRTRITQEQLLLIATKHFASLRVLHVQSTAINDDKTMVKVATICTRLEDVDVSTDPEDGITEISEITNETLRAFAEFCRGLRFVCCRTALVTNDGVIHLAKSCVCLQVIDVRHCVNVNSWALFKCLKSDYKHIKLYATSNEA